MFFFVYFQNKTRGVHGENGRGRRPWCSQALSIDKKIVGIFILKVQVEFLFQNLDQFHVSLDFDPKSTHQRTGSRTPARRRRRKHSDR